MADSEIDNENVASSDVDSESKDCECNESHGDVHKAEARAMTILVLSIMIITTIEIVIAFAFTRINPGFMAKYWTYLIYIIISVSFGGAAVWHVRCYRKSFDCGMGMMVGMTVGMLAGFVFGAIIGATNGMFVGSVYGLVIGMLVGAGVTRRCGIMSIMEGLMAGFMGGLMGAMTTVMMLADNLAIFMPIAIGSCSIMLYGMVYMIAKESERPKNKMDIYDGIIFMTVLILLAFVTTSIIAFGPKAAIVA